MIYPNNFEEKIGFLQVRELLKGKCLSTLGMERVEQMAFSEHYEEIIVKLEQTAEFVKILEAEENFPATYYFDVRSSLKRIRVEGTYLDEQELFDLKRSLETIQSIVNFLRKKREDDEDSGESVTVRYPRLTALASDLEMFPQFIRRIDVILGPYGKIKDSATVILASIRHEMASTVGSISRILNSILRSAQSEGVVEKDVAPTMRDGRLVIPVAPALKRRIKGIVHDESASGRTVFIEPAEVVEANNRIRELEGEERREILRILTEFSTYLRPSIDTVLQSYEFLADVDFIRAKALWARQTNSTLPQVEDKRMIDWVMAVHPLLQISLQKHGKKVVPLDITLNKKQRILLISGPNAGGKSVCLKTVGLLQYMLQCGMLVPMRENSHVGLFNSIFIDIGDEQSIEDDLSTYSSHLVNMKQMMKRCNSKSLILIDEFGSGTEPNIGGAIAEAVLKRFNEKGTYGVITTHYQNLKHFAEDHEGVVNGAMLYDRHLMQALYQLQIGNPGSSFAVEIARKIGFPEEVIKDASDIVGSDYINADKYLQDIVRDKRYWESKRQNIHQRERQVEETIHRYEEELKDLQKQRKELMQKAREEAAQLVKDANAKIENTIREIKEQQAEREQTRKVRQELEDFKRELEERAREEAEEKLNKKIEQLRLRQQRKQEKKEKREKQSTSATDQKAHQVAERIYGIEVGSNVRLKGQTAVGQVLEVKDQQAVVAFGSIKTTVKINRLEPAKVTPKQDELSTKSTYISEGTLDTMHDRRLNFRQDLDVRGMRGDEALQAVTYFIDDAILIGAPRVRILHGTGNGILRSLIRQYLATVPNVSQYHDEHVQFGGAGLTVVELE